MIAHWAPMFVLPNIPREAAIGCDIAALGHSKVYRTRNEARADLFDYIECCYNPRRRHSKLGYISLMEFEARAMLANPLSKKPAAAQKTNFLTRTMMAKGGVSRAEPTEVNARGGWSFTRVTAFVVAIENYRKPPKGEPLPSVDFAHADGDAFGDLIKRIYADLPDEDVSVHVLKDADASLTALRDDLKYTIKTLADDELFIFYYAGHGFHGAGGNRLSTYDTNRHTVEDTSLSMRDDLLEPLLDSECRQALVFVDACAERFSGVVKSRDVITNLDADEVRDFLDSGWYLGVFLSCSPGEKSYPSTTLKHGIWTHFLLEAMEGRVPKALTRDRWLTDFGLRDYLQKEVPGFVTRQMQVRGTQTPQAILSGSNSFQIRHVPKPPTVPVDAALAGISLRNNSEFLEGTETGKIHRLPGFTRAKGHTVPTEVSDSAEAWCQRLLSERVAEELQELYQAARKALNARRKGVQKAEDSGGGDVDTAAFRYSIETGQNPDDPEEYIILRRLELRDGWDANRAAIDEIFGNEFDRLVIEFERMDDTFDAFVEKLEDIQESQGGELHDDDRTKRVTYGRDGVTFTFDLIKRRLEISFGRSGALELVDAAQKFQLGTSRASPMLSAPTRQAAAAPSPRPVRRDVRGR